jgi:hypothetical protein
MQKELETTSELAVHAGRLLLKHYEPQPKVEWKWTCPHV